MIDCHLKVLAMRHDVVLAGQHDRMISFLNALFASESLAITLSETSDLVRIRRAITRDTEAAVIFLSDRHASCDLRDFLQTFSDVAFLFVTSTKPPRRALARVAREHGAAIVAADDGPVIAAATLFSMLAQQACDPDSGT